MSLIGNLHGDCPCSPNWRCAKSYNSYPLIRQLKEKSLLWIFSLSNTVITAAWFVLLSFPDPNILVTDLFWLFLSQKNQDSVWKARLAVSNMHFTSSSVSPLTVMVLHAQILEALDVYQILAITLFFSLLILKVAFFSIRVVGFGLHTGCGVCHWERRPI